MDGLRSAVPGCVPATILVLAVASMLGGCGGFGSQTRAPDPFEDDTKTWQEIAVTLPAPPAAANMLGFDTSAPTGLLFAIDGKTLAVGADGVVRYTLVVTSSSGVKNISYEGIRCDTYEHKLYALGHDDGTWSQARRSEWARISNAGANRAQAALAKDYLCSGKVVAGTADTIARRIGQRRTINNELSR